MLTVQCSSRSSWQALAAATFKSTILSVVCAEVEQPTLSGSDRRCLFEDTATEPEATQNPAFENNVGIDRHDESDWAQANLFLAIIQLVYGTKLVDLFIFGKREAGKWLVLITYPVFFGCFLSSVGLPSVNIVFQFHVPLRILRLMDTLFYFQTPCRPSLCFRYCQSNPNMICIIRYIFSDTETPTQNIVRTPWLRVAVREVFLLGWD